MPAHTHTLTHTHTYTDTHTHTHTLLLKVGERATEEQCSIDMSGYDNDSFETLETLEVFV